MQEVGLLVLHRLADEVVVAGDVEDRPGDTRIGQLDHRLGAERRQKGLGVDLEEVPEKPERVRGVRPEPEVRVTVRRSFLQQSISSERDSFAEQKILKKTE